MGQMDQAAFADFLNDPKSRELFNEAVRAEIRASGLGAADGALHVDRLDILNAGIESHKYARRRMKHAVRLRNRIELLQFSAQHVTLPGPALEFGVWSGDTINVISSLLPDRPVFGFDSFEGLPEEWAGLGKGHFSTDKALPAVRANVELIVGWFDQTLPQFLQAQNINQISLLHIDCDLYSSTKVVLSLLRNKVGPGTIIVFDEYFNYVGWKEHEYLAFQEFVKETEMSYDYIGIAPEYQHVAVRVEKMKTSPRN